MGSRSNRASRELSASERQALKAEARRRHAETSAVSDEAARDTAELVLGGALGGGAGALAVKGLSKVAARKVAKKVASKAKTEKAIEKIVKDELGGKTPRVTRAGKSKSKSLEEFERAQKPPTKRAQRRERKADKKEVERAMQRQNPKPSAEKYDSRSRMDRYRHDKALKEFEDARPIGGMEKGGLSAGEKAGGAAAIVSGGAMLGLTIKEDRERAERAERDRLANEEPPTNAPKRKAKRK